MYVFGLCEEARKSEDNPHRHKDNMQTSFKEAAIEPTAFQLWQR